MKRWGAGLVTMVLAALTLTACGIFDSGRLAAGGLQSYLDRAPSVDHAAVDYRPANGSGAAKVHAVVTVADGVNAKSVESVVHESASRMRAKELAGAFDGLVIASHDGAWTIAIGAREALTQPTRLDEAIAYVFTEDELPGEVSVRLGTSGSPTWTGVRRSVSAGTPIESVTTLFSEFASRPLPVWGIDDVTLSVETPAPEGSTRTQITTLTSVAGSFTDGIYLAVAGVLDSRALLGPVDGADIRVTWEVTKPSLSVIVDARPADPASGLAAAMDAQVRAALAGAGVPFSLESS